MIRITKKSMNVEYKYYKQRNKLFRYPANIINDLWHDIIKYLTFPPFMICNKNQQLNHYREITKDEFAMIKQKLCARRD